MREHPVVAERVRGTLLFHVKPHFRWLVDLREEGRRQEAGCAALPRVRALAPAEEEKADCTLLYASPAIFDALNAQRLSLGKALWRGDLKIRGSKRLLHRLAPLMKAAEEGKEAANSKDAEGAGRASPAPGAHSRPAAQAGFGAVEQITEENARLRDRLEAVEKQLMAAQRCVGPPHSRVSAPIPTRPSHPSLPPACSELRSTDPRVSTLEALALAPASPLSLAADVLGWWWGPLLCAAAVAWLAASTPAWLSLWSLPAALLLAGAAYWAHVLRSDSHANVLLRRRLRIFAISLRIYVGYKVMQWRARSLPADQAAALREITHRRHAEAAYATILSLRGMWVKTGQYLGSRADVMPDAFVSSFSRLQDAVPPRPFPEVKATLEEDLERPLRAVFSAFRRTAIAAASIGQVHVARLRDGRRVAVKVQHRGMQTLMRQDLENLDTIVTMLARNEPEANYKPVLQEWAREVVQELDFTHEAANLEEVAADMRAAGIDVLVPTALPGALGSGPSPPPSRAPASSHSLAPHVPRHGHHQDAHHALRGGPQHQRRRCPGSHGRCACGSLYLLPPPCG